MKDKSKLNIHTKQNYPNKLSRKIKRWGIDMFNRTVNLM